MKFLNYYMNLLAIALAILVLCTQPSGRISQETNQTNFSAFPVISNSAKVNSTVKRDRCDIEYVENIEYTTNIFKWKKLSFNQYV